MPGILDWLTGQNQGLGGGLLASDPTRPTPIRDWWHANPSSLLALGAGMLSQPTFAGGLSAGLGAVPQARQLDQQKTQQKALQDYFKNPENVKALSPGMIKLFQGNPALAEKYLGSQLGASGGINSASDLVQTVGPDGNPVFTPASQAVGKTPYSKPAGTYKTLTDPAERQAAGIDPTDKGIYQKDETTGKVYSVGNSGGLFGAANPDDVQSLADGIQSGNTPPTSIAKNSRFNAPVLAELSRRGVDLSELTTDWTATQKHYAALNSTQQTRLRQNITTVKGTLQTIRGLASEWQAGGYPLLNKVNREAALQGVLGPDANRIATLLGAQIADVTGEMGSVLMGGNSPTDHAMELAAQNLSADWSFPTLVAALDQFDKNIAFRENAIANVGTAGVPDSKYNYGNNAADLPPASGTPSPLGPDTYGATSSAPAAGPVEGSTATGPNGERIILRNGQWVPLQ